MIPKKILFLHGMESGIKGKKTKYLYEHYDKIIVPELHPWWCFPLTFRNAYKAYVTGKPDVVIASSLGSILCSFMIFFKLINCPVILLAPPLSNVLKYLWYTHLNAGKKILIIYALDDHFNNWSNVFNKHHVNLHQIVIDDQHNLNTLLKNDKLDILIQNFYTYT